MVVGSLGIGIPDLGCLPTHVPIPSFRPKLLTEIDRTCPNSADMRDPRPTMFRRSHESSLSLSSSNDRNRPMATSPVSMAARSFFDPAHHRNHTGISSAGDAKTSSCSCSSDVGAVTGMFDVLDIFSQCFGGILGVMLNLFSIFWVLFGGICTSPVLRSPQGSPVGMVFRISWSLRDVCMNIRPNTNKKRQKKTQISGPLSTSSCLALSCTSRCRGRRQGLFSGAPSSAQSRCRVHRASGTAPTKTGAKARSGSSKNRHRQLGCAEGSCG